MGMTDSINCFVDTMLEQELKFREIKREFDQKDRAITSCIEDLRFGLSEIMGQDTNLHDADLQAAYQGAVNLLGDLMSAVVHDIEKTQKGMSFIKKYEQTFNVAVLGKVKAGKSYLGNFIMGNRIRDLGIPTSYDRIPHPTVEVYDRGKITQQAEMTEIEGSDAFQVKTNEATSTIQLFHLGAMTWFDTPGIGSVTWENEMLAKDYVDNADLIIYTANSDAAGTQQDLRELGDLYQKRKQFLLLLTQSDTIEDDYDEEAEELVSVRVPKSQKDRADTENYMVQTLCEQGVTLRDDEILTISAMLAMDALKKGDEALFQASHMGDFLDILTCITTTDGAELKRKTPSLRTNAAIDEICTRLVETCAKLDTYRKDLKTKQRELGNKAGMIQEQLKAQCRTRAESIVRKSAAEVEQSGRDISGDELNSRLSQMMADVILTACRTQFSGSDTILSDYGEKLGVGSIGDLQKKTESIKYKVQKVEWVERAPSGLIEHIAHFFGRRYHETVSSEEEVSQSFDVGVNTTQVLTAVMAEIDTLFANDIPEMIERISNQYVMNLDSLLDKGGDLIWKTHAALSALK